MVGRFGLEGDVFGHGSGPFLAYDSLADKVIPVDYSNISRSGE
jgi:hypothetical protein